MKKFSLFACMVVAVFALCFGGIALLNGEIQSTYVNAKNGGIQPFENPIIYVVENESDFTTAPASGGIAITGLVPTIRDMQDVYLNIIIPNEINGLTVRNIADDAFNAEDIEAFGNQGNIISVTLPDGLVFLGQRSFRDNMLTEITIPEGVTNIRHHSLRNNRLTNVSFGENVTEIGESAFADNYLTNFVIPYGVINIRARTFQNNKLTNVIIPESVIAINTGAFQGNYLTTVVLPSELESLGSHSFRDNLLTSITIPGTLLIIGQEAFRNNELTSVRIEHGVGQINLGAFNENLLETIIIPSTVTTIASNAFLNNGTAATFFTDRAEGDIPVGWHANWNAANHPVVWDLDVRPMVTISHTHGTSSIATGQVDWVSDMSITFESLGGIIDIRIDGVSLTNLTGYERSHANYNDTRFGNSEIWSVNALTGNSITLNLSRIAHNIDIQVISNEVYTISIATNPTGQNAGEVVVQDNETLASIAPGTQRTLTAKPNTGFKFVNWTITGTTITDLTSATITLTVGTNNITATANFEAIVITGATLETNTTKPNWYMHETFAVSGIEIEITYSDGSTRTITTGFTVETTTWVVGTVTVTIRYGTHTAGAFNITVATPTITGATLENNATKQDWLLDETFSVSGLEVELTYSDGNTRTITTGLTVTTSTWAVGAVTVRVYYGIHFAGDFTVNVTNNVITNPANEIVSQINQMIANLSNYTTASELQAAINAINTFRQNNDYNGATYIVNQIELDYQIARLATLQETNNGNGFPWLIITAVAGALLLMLGIFAVIILRVRRRS